MSVMPALIATIVDTEALLETCLAALVAGVGVALTFSLAILGATGFAEASRDGRTGSAAAFAVLGVAGFLATAAAIVAAIIVMTSE
jgi:hypothetical protein